MAGLPFSADEKSVLFPQLLFFVAVTIRPDRANLRYGCAADEAIVATLPAGALVELGFALSDGSDCFKIAGTVDDKRVEGYVSASDLSGLDHFERERRRAPDPISVQVISPHLTRSVISNSNDPAVSRAAKLLEVNQPVTSEIANAAQADQHGRPLSADQQYACEKFGPACRVALAIQRAENPSGRCEIYHYNSDGTLDWGYFQINTVHLKRPGLNLHDLLDCKANIDFAVQLYQERHGFTPWSTYTSGAYLQRAGKTRVRAVTRWRRQRPNMVPKHPVQRARGTLLPASFLLARAGTQRGRGWLFSRGETGINQAREFLRQAKAADTSRGC
jgi:hypothetical protein